MGFNSLCAHASVNHLHFHTWYSEHPSYLETAVSQCWSLHSFKEFTSSPSCHVIACKRRRISGCRFSLSRSQASHMMTLKSLCEAGCESVDCSQSDSVPSSVVFSSPN